MTAIDTDGGTEQEIPRKKLSGKKIVLFVVLPVVILVGGGAAVYFSGILNPKKDEHAEGDHAAAGPAPEVECNASPAFFDLPEMIVNLNADERRPALMKLGITLDLCREEDRAPMTAVLPRITDTFQVYLRELRTDDLKGSAGAYRLQEELRMRVNAAAYPIRVRDVLFKEMIVQ